jgi:hypothetical protein
MESRTPIDRRFDWRWFEIEEELLDGPQTAFIETVRSHAATWSFCRPLDTCALIDEDEDDPRELTLIMDVIRALTGSIANTLGVVLNGDSIRCGETHTQNYVLLDTQRIEVLEASGSPQELGAMAASWLERTAMALSLR